MYKILFICTDNIGRSLTAKYLFEDWIRKNGRGDIEISSAGTHANSDISSFAMDHISKLRAMGVDASGHVRTQLTREILLKHDLSIVMDEEQQAWVRDMFNIRIPLYNEIYKDEKSSVRISVPGMTEAMGERLGKMVDYIAESIPVMMERFDNMARAAQSVERDGL